MNETEVKHAAKFAAIQGQLCSDEVADLKKKLQCQQITFKILNL